MKAQSNHGSSLAIGSKAGSSALNAAGKPALSDTTLYVSAASLTKSADALVNMRLVVVWLATALGAPAVLVGMIIPLREALSMLPQVVAGPFILRFERRKAFWVAGCVIQAVAVAGMALAALAITDIEAGLTILGLIAVFSLGRCFASLTLKDIQGRIIPEDQRGRSNGLPGAIAGSVGFGLGLVFVLIGDTREPGWIAVLLGAAALLWLAGVLVFLRLDEPPAETVSGDKTPGPSLAIMVRNRTFIHFLLSRILLVSTTVMPAFVVLAAEDYGVGGLGQLGWLVMALGLASTLSSTVWGRLSDDASHRAMAAGGILAAAAVLGVVFLDRVPLEAAGRSIALTVLLFLIGIGYAGVRIGRKTFVINMADDESRAAYVATANSVTGVFVLATGAFGLLADGAGLAATLVILAGLAACGGTLAATLPKPRAGD